MAGGGEKKQKKTAKEKTESKKMVLIPISVPSSNVIPTQIPSNPIDCRRSLDSLFHFPRRAETLITASCLERRRIT